jgi:hypothetical protein
MPTLVLAAVFASSLDPGSAWSDVEGWAKCPRVVLSGIDGAKVDATSVRARWNEEWLCFEFVCRDQAIVSPGRRDGEDHFKLGDVVEVFVGRDGKPNYLEVHATPAGRKAVYAFRDYREAGPAPVGPEVRCAETGDGWRAVMMIPWSALGGAPDNGAWEFLAGRYDYDTSGGRAVLSSFPEQSGKPDFHQRSRYAQLELQR